MENLEINDQLSPPVDNEANNPVLRVDQKFDEFISAFQAAPLTAEQVEAFELRFRAAVRAGTQVSTAVQPYSRIPVQENGDSDVEQLLFLNNLDSRAQRRVVVSNVFGHVVRVIIALLLIGLGFGMIIMPAPPYFEMFTLFYLNPNDGVTIMDVISLIVAFTGVYLLVQTIIKISRR